MFQKTNKAAGTAFENEFAKLLQQNGYWAHLLRQNDVGQPADLIASIDNRPFLIDCKDCQGDRFRFSRIEQNQRDAMTRWFDCGNKTGWFAIKLYGKVYMVSYATILGLEYEGYRSMALGMLERYGVSFERWCAVEGYN